MAEAVLHPDDCLIIEGVFAEAPGVLAVEMLMNWRQGKPASLPEFPPRLSNRESVARR